MLRVLLVDDEPLIRLSVGDALKDAGYELTLAADGGEAVACLERNTYDVLISDIRLPKVDGMTLFRKTRGESPSTDVILITAYGAVSDAVSAFKEGATDYITKPFDADELVVRLERIAEVRGLRAQLVQAKEDLAKDKSTRSKIIGQSPEMDRLFDRVGAFATSDASVLITGESGTGKELVARALHNQSVRAAKSFVAVNCAAFPETLLEAELFGHERGAFTGATKRREGRFQAAHGGTLFLDEVAEIPMPAQAKLLRVLQERIVEPLGTNRAIPVDVRILSATHRNLKEYIANGRFREDLYYRLNVLQLDIPPLRDRKPDLPLLVEHFLHRLAPANTKPSISDRALLALYNYDFPGNVRELEHAIHHGVVLARGQVIDIEHLPNSIVESARDVSQPLPAVIDMTSIDIQPLSDAVKGFEREYLIRALRKASGKRTQAAKILAISRKNLWEKVQKHTILDEEFR